MFAVDFIWGLNVIFIRFEVGAFQRQPLSRIQTVCASLSVHWHAKPISFACSSTRIPGHDSPAAKHTSFQPTGLWLPPLPHTILSHSGHKVSSSPSPLPVIPQPHPPITAFLFRGMTRGSSPQRNTCLSKPVMCRPHQQMLPDLPVPRYFLSLLNSTWWRAWNAEHLKAIDFGNR